MSAQPGQVGTAGRGGRAVTPSLAPAAAPLSDDERRVWDLLPHGRLNAITQARLAAAAGVSTRQLQDILKSLTEDHGLPVCAACSEPMGSFVPATPAEAEPYIRQLRSRALSCFVRIKALSGSVARELLAEVQETLDFGSPANTRVGARDTQVCPQCVQLFAPARDTQMYCSDVCRYRAANERRAS